MPTELILVAISLYIIIGLVIFLSFSIGERLEGEPMYEWNEDKWNNIIITSVFWFLIPIGVLAILCCESTAKKLKEMLIKEYTFKLKWRKK